MSIVTDPDILAELNADTVPPASENRNPLDIESAALVTDPEILKRLNDPSNALTPKEYGLLETVLNTQENGEPADKDSWADWIAPTLNIGAAFTVGTRGFTVGAAYTDRLGLPPQLSRIAKPIGGTAGTLFAMYPTVYGITATSEVIEDLVEGREYDPDAAFREAYDAANTDALITFAIPVAGATVKAGWTLTKKTGGAAIGFGKSKLSPKQIEMIIALQRSLKEFDPKATLTPFAASGGKGFWARYMTNVGAVSAFTKATVDNLLNTYDLYMGNQLKQVINGFKGATPFKQGRAIQTFIQQVDLAIDDIVTPMYKSIEMQGSKIIVDPTERGKQLYKDIVRAYRGKPKYNKQGELIPNTQYPSGAIKQASEELNNLPSDLTFSEAHARLSRVKKRLYKAQNTASPSPEQNELIDILKQTRKMYQDAMDEAAENLNPKLKAEYDKVTEFYSRGRSKVEATYIQRALDVSDPSEVGALLTQAGAELPIKQLKELMDYAKSIKVHIRHGAGGKNSVKPLALDADPMSRLRKGYLEQLFKLEGQGGIDSLAKLRENLKEPKFRATFNTIFEGTDVPKQIDDILAKLDILDKTLPTGSGLQLSVAQAEIGALRGGKKLYEKLRDLLPSFYAAVKFRPKSIDNYLETMEVVANAQATGKFIPDEYLMRIGNYEKLVLASSAVSGTFIDMEDSYSSIPRVTDDEGIPLE